MNKLFELEFGSSLYGTRTENSDLDLKAIYLPTAREIVLGTYKKTITTQRPKAVFERNNKDDVDIEVFSLDRYLKLLSEGQTVALDILFAHNEMFTAKNPANWHIFQEIKQNKDKLICKDLAAFIGYAKQQAAKYGLKGFRVAALEETLTWLETQPENEKLDERMFSLRSFVYKPILPVKSELNNEFISLEILNDKKGYSRDYLKVCDKYYQTNVKIKDIKEQIQKRYDQYGSRAIKAKLNEGIDWKALSHAVRVNSQGVELLNTGIMTFPRPDRQLLLDIKLGKMEYNEVADIIVEGLENLNSAQEKSTLRDKPDQSWIDDFVFTEYTNVIGGNK